MKSFLLGAGAVALVTFALKWTADIALYAASPVLGETFWAVMIASSILAFVWICYHLGKIFQDSGKF